MSTFTSAAATIIKATALGATAAGAIGIPGLQVGDVLTSVVPAGFMQGMEQVVSQADQLQQNANLDWSTLTFTIYLLRGV